MAGINHVAVKSTGDKGLASEWNDDHEQKGNHDCAKFQHLNHVIENRTTWPAGPVEGQIIYRIDLNSFFIWDGTNWESFENVSTVLVAVDGSGDYDNIQDGIDALPASGGIVYIKEGTYTISASITIAIDNVALKGAGYATIIKIRDNHNLDINAIEAFNQSYIYIEGLSIDGNKANQAAGEMHGVFFDTVAYSKIINCWFENLQEGEGVYLTASTFNVISNNSSINNDERGIFLFDGSDNNIVIGNICRDNVFSGISLDIASNNSITGNNCYSNTEEGILVHDASNNNTVTGNNCQDNTQNGIFVGITVEQNTVTGNNCKDNGENGILVAWGIDDVINGNNCCSNTLNGILIDSTSDDNTITGNRCKDNGVNGIKIGNANCDNNVVSGNHCTGNIGASIVDNGTNTLPNGAVGTTNLQLDDLNYV